MRRHKKRLAKRNWLETYKKVLFSLKNRYLEWTEGSGDNAKECTSTEGKTSVAQALYTTTR